MPTKTLTGKVALITGASKGLGKAMALALGEAGASLALVSRDQKGLKATADANRVASTTPPPLPAGSLGRWLRMIWSIRLAAR